jgi:hypothetical protein
MARKLVIVIVLAAALLLAIQPVSAGGWSVTTLDEWPACVVAGEPLSIGFVVRQHGIHALEDLAPEIVAQQEDEAGTFSVMAEEDTPAHYTAELVFPTEGEWQWKFRAFGPEQALPPLTVLPAGSPCPAAPDDPDPADLVAWGTTLFDAKGCSVCHLHQDAAVKALSSFSTGPELTDFQGEPDMLCRWLADPAALDADTYMPDLNLHGPEIEYLIAFLNANDGEPADSAAGLPGWCDDLLGVRTE